MAYSCNIKSISYKIFFDCTEKLVSTEAQKPFYPRDRVAHVGEVYAPVFSKGPAINRTNC